MEGRRCLRQNNPKTYNSTVENRIRQNTANHPDRTLNYEDGLAFKMDLKTELYTRVATCLMGEPKFYKEVDEQGNITADNQDNALISLIPKVAALDPEFILKLALYTRTDLHLRTIPIVVLVEASLIDSCKPFVKNYVPRIIQRADELAEATAYLQAKIGHLGNKKPKGSMPASLKKGLAEALHNFNEYQFAKYNRKGVVKLKDVVRLTHPTPYNDEESALFKRILTDTLKTPDTWEVVISTKGSTKENWEAISPKMPIMASIRNLRNFLEKKVNMTPILDKLTNPEIIKKSKQLPFRFLSAYREIEKVKSVDTASVLDVLETAMDLSVVNLPRLTGTTFISADNSGSMTNHISKKSSVTLADIANILMAITHRICDRSITSIFGSDFKVKNMSRRSILASANSIVNDEVGSSTNAYLALDYLINGKINVDRIVILSDCQTYDDVYYSENVHDKVQLYLENINPKTYIYSIDLAGYGTTDIALDTPNIFKIAGWSERILDFIKIAETDKRTAVDTIDKINLSKIENVSEDSS